MLIQKINKHPLSYNDKLATYNGKDVLFHFPEYVIETGNFTFTEQDMGEAIITVSVLMSPDATPDFSLDWTIRYKGEFFKLKTLSPPGKKDTSSLQYQYDLTFESERADLKHYMMADMRQLDDGSLQQVSHDFAFFGTLQEFVDRFNQNLQYCFPERWRIELNPSVIINPTGVTVSCHKATLWDTLTQLYDLYDVRWSIVNKGGQMVIIVGYQSVEIEHIFEYGLNNGLTSIQRVNPLVDIYTRLYGRGSTRNVPYRYFKNESGNWPGDPDANDELLTAYMPNLMPSSTRQYVQGWNDAKAGRPSVKPGNIIPNTDAFLGWSTEHIEPFGKGAIEYKWNQTASVEQHSQDFAMDAGKQYTLSFNYETRGGFKGSPAVASFRIDDRVSGPIQTIKSVNIDVGSGVRHASATFTVPAGFSGLAAVVIQHLGAIANGTSSSIFIDSIMLNEGANALPWTYEENPDTKYYRMGYSDQKSGRKLHLPYYAESANIAKWGVREGVVEDNDKIYPSIQGIWLPAINGYRRGRADEIVAVEKVTNDDWSSYDPQAKPATNPIQCQSTFKHAKRTVESSNKSDVIVTSVLKDTLSFEVKMQYFDSKLAPHITGTIKVSLMNEAGDTLDTKFFTTSMINPPTRIPPDNKGEFTIPTAGNYYIYMATILTYSGSFGWAGIFDNTWCSVGVTNIINKPKPGIGEYKPTFDIWIKDVWGETGTLMDIWGPKIGQNEATVMFSDGLLAGDDYEFRIVKDPVLGNPLAVDFNGKDLWCIWEDDSKSITTKDEDGKVITVKSKYRLTLEKSESELDASGMYLPNVMQNAIPGDHFFFINMEMPHQYVLWAEERLQDWLIAELARVDDEFPTYAVVPSAIFCDSFEEAELLRAGAKMRVRNQQLAGDGYLVLYITSLTLRFSDGKKLPQWNVVISDKMVGNKTTTNFIEGEIQRLSSNIYSSQQAITEAVRQMERTYLRKDGIEDTSYSPTRFTSDVTLESDAKSSDFSQGDFSGSGWSIYKDTKGASVMEVDKLVVRREMRVNELVVNQVTFVGGKQIFSAAGSKIERVEIVRQNDISDLNPTIDTSLASSGGWNIDVASDVAFVEFNGEKCMKLTGEPAGVSLDSGIGIFEPNIQKNTSIDIYPTAIGYITFGASGESESTVVITDDMLGEWTRISNTVQPTTATPVVVHSGCGNNPLYVKNIKIEAGGESSGYTSSSQESYRCYIDTNKGSNLNGFVVYDQVYHQSFNTTESSILRYYWRLVTRVGADYIDLSKDDKDGDSIPMGGDNIAQLGNRTNTSRQSAIMMDIVREGGAMMSWYDDIGSYNLIAKDNINLGRINGKTWAEVFGNMYIGNRARSKYLKYENGKLEFRGDVFQAAADVSRIVGNFIVTGGFLGVSTTGNESDVKSGLTAINLLDAETEDDKKVRLWAGTSHNNRGKAPFRVLESGKMYAENAEIKGTVKATHLEAVDGFLQGVTTASNKDGARVEIDPVTRGIILYDNNNNIVGRWTYSNGFSNIDMETFGSSGFKDRLGMTPAAIHMERGTNSVWMSRVIIDPTSLAIRTRGAYEFYVGAGRLNSEGKSELSFELKNLPTSSKGLQPGFVWVDGTTLKIVK